MCKPRLKALIHGSYLVIHGLSQVIRVLKKSATTWAGLQMAHQFKPRLRKPYLNTEPSHYYEYEKWIILRFSLNLSTSTSTAHFMNDPYNMW